jgi:hypothetical protein
MWYNDEKWDNKFGKIFELRSKMGYQAAYLGFVDEVFD